MDRSIIVARDLLAFPTGDNSSDTVISGAHFNLTTLNYWNYTYYSNGTISNGSRCILTFDPYTPTLLFNGTFLNSTSCYSPISPMGPRGIAGLIYGTFLGGSIILTSINLRKHGRTFLPTQKRFHPIGRRWSWYWMFVVAILGSISFIGSIDVDRYYLPEFPMILTTFMWFLMLPATMASVWESVRHWGSWQERQIIDSNSFSLAQDDRREKTEFWIPLVFYLFCVMNFFLTIPRGWTAIEKQRSPDQQASIAKPAATDSRFKAASFMLFLSWLVICFSLTHSLQHYKPRNRGILKSVTGFFRHTPIKFLLNIPLSLLICGYSALSAFDFSFSPLNINCNAAWIIGLGWTPIALIILINEIWGYIDPNEDKELIRQRRSRGAEMDREMGYTKKPQWWSRLRGDQYLSVSEAITKNVREVSGRRVPDKDRSLEMLVLPTSPSHQKINSTGKAAPSSANKNFSSLSLAPPDHPVGPPDQLSASTKRGRLGCEGENTETRNAYERSPSSTSGTTLTSPGQKIRSMLNV